MDVINIYDKAEALQIALNEFMEAIGLKWNYEEDEYSVDFPEFRDPMWGDFLSDLESVSTDLDMFINE